LWLFPLIVSVTGTAPGPCTAAEVSGAASADVSRRPAPSAPPPIPTPRRNPRRETGILGFFWTSDCFLESSLEELTRHHPFISFSPRLQFGGSSEAAMRSRIEH